MKRCVFHGIGGGRDALTGSDQPIHRAQARLVVLLKLNTPAVQLGDLRLQVLDDLGRDHPR